MARSVGTASEVVEAFIDAATLYPNRTPSAPVPGGCRVSMEQDANGLNLYSYRTIVARRLYAIDAVAITPRKYSVTTSKMMGRLTRSLAAQGYRPTDETVIVNAAVPGRWGGFGPAWHATGWEALPFVVWTRPSASEEREARWARIAAVYPEAAAEAREVWNRCTRHLDAQHAEGECGDTPGGPLPR